MSKGKNERIEELEKQVKNILWCIDWDFNRIKTLTDRVEVLEADLKARKNAETRFRLMTEALSARARAGGDSFSGWTADSKPSGGSIPSSPANAFDLPTGHTAWGSSSTAQFSSTTAQCEPCLGTVIECTRNHICGRDNDPCNGWARTVTPKPLEPTNVWSYRPGCPCLRCLNFKGTEA